MTLLQILLLSAGTLAIGGLLPTHWRTYLFLSTSLICTYWLQPALTIRRMDFWLPTIGIGIAILIWAFTQSGQPAWLKYNWKAASIVIFVPVIISGLRYLEPLCCFTPSRPPALPAVLLVTTIIAVFAWIVRNQPYRSSIFLIGTLIIIFIILKTNPLAESVSAWLRRLSGQDPALASAVELQWLGFSYIAFRLIHVGREYQSGRLRAVPLADLLVYTFFYPTLVAGPIDRLPRFSKDLHNTQSITALDIHAGGERILIGVFKKFAIADTLALIALNTLNAAQIHHAGWAWTVLYAYSLRIYFDFSGYTDIALGIGRLAGFQLPENFQAPYLKTDITAFWNSWHITLAQWFRAYLFNPLTRFLRTRPESIPVWLIILIGQISTMGLIGLWHGITVNFLIWGLWHAAGLFLHNRWSQWLRNQPEALGKINLSPWMSKIFGWVLTFHFVTLGWVWFALPDFSTALRFIQQLLSIG